MKHGIAYYTRQPAYMSDLPVPITNRCGKLSVWGATHIRLLAQAPDAVESRRAELAV